jgi:hypothetical protein
MAESSTGSEIVQLRASRAEAVPSHALQYRTPVEDPPQPHDRLVAAAALWACVSCGAVALVFIGGAVEAWRDMGRPSLVGAGVGAVIGAAAFGALFAGVSVMAACDAYRRLRRTAAKVNRGWNGIGESEPPPLRRLRRR